MARITHNPFALSILGLCAALALACAQAGPTASSAVPEPFVLAMIPDTQNYVDYTHQKAEGFAIDASEIFIHQMRWIAERSRDNGGNIAFVASVGDVWQHQSKLIDEAHAARGVTRSETDAFGGHFEPGTEVLEIEMPHALEGYGLISEAGLPFGVAPGNHDYDAMWSLASHPPNPNPDPENFSWDDLGVSHVGGLDNFRTVFGDQSPFFKDRDWYVSSHDGGSNSAQVFRAGGYDFLHIAIEMQAGDAVLDWMRSVMATHPGIPTIVSTHDYLNVKGERAGFPLLDLTTGDPEHHNTSEDLWQKLISRHDQIFLVLCGHHAGQSQRVDTNTAGHEVYQMLADFQDRGQVGLDAGQPIEVHPPFVNGPAPLGDGWFRLLEFHLGSDAPRIDVRTYSTHYEKLSGELDTYAAWYREREQPAMTDAEFLAADEFQIPLVDFPNRFGPPTAH
jgi:hypothetical protein